MILQWQPTPEQQAVAEYLAAGYSQNRTSLILKPAPGVRAVSLRTIQRWWANSPEFRSYVYEVRENLRALQLPMFQTTIVLAQDLVFKAMAGEIPADDPRVGLAERVLTKTLYRLVASDARVASATLAGLERQGAPQLPEGRGGAHPDDDNADSGAVVV